MNKQNNLVQFWLGKAVVAVKQLDALGCTVTEITLRDKAPVIRIDGHGTDHLAGVQARSITIAGVTHRTMALTVEDCRVEWDETFISAREAQRA